jgi:hypothetical protein
MAAIDVSISLCLNKYAVPLVEEILGFVDPYNLSDDADEELPVSLVNFNATGDKAWLNSGLEKDARWWVRNAHRVPLLGEVLMLIMNQKVKKGADVLMPRRHQSLMPLQVRGKILWFKNNARCVTLALKQGHEVEQFKWFIKELKKDLENLPNEEPEAKKLSKVEILKEIHDPVENALKTLRDHPGCSRANYVPSRMAFRLLRADNATMDIRVKNLKRKRAEALQHEEQEGLSRQFDLALQACVDFLEHRYPEQPEPAVPEEAPQAAEGLAEEPEGPAEEPAVGVAEDLP